MIKKCRHIIIATEKEGKRRGVWKRDRNYMDEGKVEQAVGAATEGRGESAPGRRGEKSIFSWESGDDEKDDFRGSALCRQLGPPARWSGEAIQPARVKIIKNTTNERSCHNCHLSSLLMPAEALSGSCQVTSSLAISSQRWKTRCARWL